VLPQLFQDCRDDAAGISHYLDFSSRFEGDHSSFFHAGSFSGFPKYPFK
jgi:hypothetical protein